MGNYHSQLDTDRNRAVALAVLKSLGNDTEVLGIQLGDKDLIILHDKQLIEEVRYLQSFAISHPFFADWLAEEIIEAKTAVIEEDVTSMIMEFCDVIFLLMKFDVLHRATNVSRLMHLVAHLIGGDVSSKIKKDWRLLQDPIIHAIDQWNDKNESRGRQVVAPQTISKHVLTLIRASRVMANLTLKYLSSDDQPQSQVDGFSLPILSQEEVDHE